MQSTELHSPAKINLGLNIHHRRPADGYHFISSIFIPISFGDTLIIEEIDQDSLVSQIFLPDSMAADYAAVSESADFKSNLIWQTLGATRRLRPVHTGLKVTLHKYIPTGGGLGGGSSNAGRLLALIHKRYHLNVARIESIALTLGADVPFFLESRPALVTGIGEERLPIQIGKGYGILCFSGIKIETGVAYERLKRALQEALPPKTLRGLDVQTLDALQKADWANIGGLENDFEGPVFDMHPELAAIKAAFYDMGAAFALMSGSGATVYALLASSTEQDAVLALMQAAFPEYHFWPFYFG